MIKLSERSVAGTYRLVPIHHTIFRMRASALLMPAGLNPGPLAITPPAPYAWSRE